MEIGEEFDELIALREALQRIATLVSGAGTSARPSPNEEILAEIEAVCREVLEGRPE